MEISLGNGLERGDIQNDYRLSKLKPFYPKRLIDWIANKQQ